MSLTDKKLTQFKDNLTKETVIEKTKQNWHLPALTAIFLLAFALRYTPEKGMQYLQAADPFYIFRMSQHIALEGTLPQLDFMRYFPYATPNYTVQLGELLIPAIMYNAGFSLFFENYLEWAQFYPALMGSLTVLLMYFLGKELFNKKTGLAAAFFLTVTAAALRRASAGFFEKEPIGTFLMMSSLLFFTRAWKNESWANGILSGLSLGLFTISWGGSQMLWLLYPILTGITLFLNVETRNLVTSYTPTIIVAAFVAAASNPGRFWFTDSLFLIAAGALGLLWMRYLIEELNILQEKYLPYFVPSMAAIGGIMAILSPLYSQWLANKLLRFVRVATGNTGNSVVGQTVQENAAPGITSLATDLGSILFGNLQNGLGSAAILVSPWTFMLFAVTFLSTTLLLMTARKYNIIEKTITGKKHIAYTQAVFIAVMIAAAGLLQNMVIIFGAAAAVLTASIITMIYFIEENAAFTITSMFLIGLTLGLAIMGTGLTGSAAAAFLYLTLIPAAAAMTATLALYTLDFFPEKTIEYKWYYLIPVVWIASNVYGGTTRSRLVFLSTFAVALGAGYGFSKTISKLRNLEYGKIQGVKPGNLKTITIILVIGLVGGLNLTSGYVMSQNITGSPTPTPEIWQPSIDYMQNEAPEGSVVLSWWDYGYNFQTLGRKASVADGGNLLYYTNEGNHQNQYLAQYLNSTTENDTEFIQKHSADYIWLDHGMISKFAPVSQIANNDNQDYQTINQLSTPGTLQDSTSREGNNTVVNFRGGLQRNLVDVFAPVQFSNNSAELSGPPTIRLANGQTAQIGCVLTNDGEKQNYQVQNELPFCAAEDPFYTLERGTIGTQSRLLLIPETISDSTFVELYVQDGENVEYAEKINEASNGYIKMWEIQQ